MLLSLPSPPFRSRHRGKHCTLQGGVLGCRCRRHLNSSRGATRTRRPSSGSSAIIPPGIPGIPPLARIICISMAIWSASPPPPVSHTRMVSIWHCDREHHTHRLRMPACLQPTSGTNWPSRDSQDGLSARRSELAHHAWQECGGALTWGVADLLQLFPSFGVGALGEELVPHLD
jgi:hypothetical protein